jgi:hypothetical protein
METPPDLAARQPSILCPACGFDVLVPIVPMFDVALVASLVGMRADALCVYLNQHPAEFPKRYRRKFDRQKRYRIRVLTAQEARKIADLHMWPKVTKTQRLKAERLNAPS